MVDTVLVLNNPASVLILFTTLAKDVDEIWIETGASAQLDRRIERALSVLQIERDLPVRHIRVENLFTAGGERKGKVRRYREIAGQVSAVCKAERVKTLICSTTSSFRLADVDMLRVVDHGTGDYLRPPIKMRIERLKYALIYAPPGRRSFAYYAFVSLPGRTHLHLDRALIRDRLAGLDHPFDRDRISVLLLVHPFIPIEDQLRRLAAKMDGTPYDLYLKGHHFDPQTYATTAQDDIRLPAPKALPDDLDALPAELLLLGFEAPTRLASFESTALWHIGVSAPSRVLFISRRSEILDLALPWRSGLGWLENALGYAPLS